MDPLAGVLLGAALVYLLFSGRTGSLQVGSGGSRGVFQGPLVDSSRAIYQGSRPQTTTQANQQARTTMQLQGSKPVTSPTSSAPSRTQAVSQNASANALGNSILNAAAPAIGFGASEVLRGTGEAVSRLGGSTQGLSTSIVTTPGKFPGASASETSQTGIKTAGTVLQSIGDNVSGAAASLGGVFSLAGVGGANAFTSKFRGATQAQQSQILGQSALKTTQFALGFIPVAGSLAGNALGAAAGTYEGQRAVAATGAGLEAGYQAQRSILAGDISKGVSQLFGSSGVFGGGGSDTQSRNSNLFGLVASRVSQLQKGGALSALDVSGFKNAAAYGIRFVNGVDLSQLNLTQPGTNPFLSKSSSYTAANKSAATPAPIGPLANFYRTSGALFKIGA